MTLSSTIGREPITIVEIDQDRCSRTYGVAPCTAAIGVTGTTKCYNTLASCQDEPHYALGDPLVLRFVTPVEDTALPRTLTLIPSLVSVDTVPTRINVGAGNQDASPLGERATVTIEIRDHPYHDRAVDPYPSIRTFDATSRGTFWSKWLARNPFYQGRAARIYHGYVGQNIDEMSVRHYIIDRIDGPASGIVRIIVKDQLRLIDDNRVKAPDANFGVLDADLNEVGTAITLAPGGVGGEYGASGIARIGSELVSFTRSGDAITLTARGLRDSGATTHSEGDLFQQVLVIENQRVDVLLADLIVNYGGVDSAFVPTAEWDAEADLWCSGFNLSAWITEPTGIGKLVAEICENTGSYIWWDDENQKIRFRATRPFYPATDTAALEISGNSNIVADTLQIEARPEERITQVWIYYGQINPVGATDDPSNFGRRRVLIDSNSQASIRYGDKRVRKIFARFLDSANDGAASAIAARILDRAHDVPKIFRFSADAKDSDIKTGAVVRLTHRDIVGLLGEMAPIYLQIVSSEQSEPGHRIDFEARQYIARTTRYCFVVADDAPSYSAATTEEKESGGWISPNAVGFANGDFPYNVL